jgi:chemotaxis protein MotB
LAPPESRTQRKNLLKGGNDARSVPGDHARVQDIRRGRSATSGGVIYFEEESAELTEASKQELEIIAMNLAGKPQKIEIRGHTSRRPVDPNAGVRDHWDLAFGRCYNTMQHLVSLGIDPERIRLGSSAAFEPVEEGLDVEERKRNARVEVLLWDERVGEGLQGP